MALGPECHAWPTRRPDTFASSNSCSRTHTPAFCQSRKRRQQAARGRPTRFLTCGRRLVVGASCWGGRKTGQNPTDRSRPGSKHHILVDANGVPVCALLTGANRNDVTQLLPLVDAIPPIRGVRGRPLQKPKVIYPDRGYDSEPHRPRLRERGIKPVIAKRRTEPNTVAVLAAFAGWSNALMRGSTISVVFAFASSVGLIFTKHS